MRPDLDPSHLTPDERRRAVVAILAGGLRRLRDRTALVSSPTPENPSETEEKPLEPVLENPLSVHDG